MRYAQRVFIILVGLILIPNLTGALAPQTNPAEPIVVRAFRAEGPVVVDGKLTESFWMDSRAVTAFIQKDPVEGSQPTEKTSVDVVYDDQAIYIGARMYDSAPGGIIARLGRKDVVQKSDSFFFFIDPYNDHRTGFYFGLNAGGTQFDGTLYNDGWDDDSWDGIWEGKVNVDEKGWTAEMRIPYSQLRFRESAKPSWGVNFKREIARKNELDYLVYTPKNESAFVSRFPDMTGMENISPPRRMEIMPYANTRAEYTGHDAGDPFNDGSLYKLGAGADLRLGLGTNLTLNGTVNPDFGQVEVDPAVVNLSDVETFYQEKRPFFTDGLNNFNFGKGGANNYWNFNWQEPEFFYSRRIGRAPQGSVLDADFEDVPTGTRIIGAAKLTGKIGSDINIGTLHAFTARETADLERDGRQWTADVEPFAYYGVTRMQKEINGGRQGLGFMTTFVTRSFNDTRLRDDVNSHSVAVGTDGWTFLDSNKAWVLTGWAGVTHISGDVSRMTDVQKNSQHYFQRPDADYVHLDSTATSLNGFAGRVALNKEKGNFFLNSAIGVISPGFDINDLGFLWRADQINAHVGAGYRWTKTTRYTRYSEVVFAAFRTMDFGGNTTSTGLFQCGSISFLNNYSFDWSFVYNPQTVNDFRTRGGPRTLNMVGVESDFSMTSDSRKTLVYGAATNLYNSYDNKDRYFETSIEWKPASNFSLQFIPSYERFKTPAKWIDNFDDPLASSTYGTRYLFGKFDQKTFSSSIRMNWTFTQALSLQLYAQPLVSSGKYWDYEELAQPKSYDFRVYDPGNIKKDGDTIIIDPEGPGKGKQMTFEDPNFNYKSLRGNVIVRWEYRPGSILYFVWTQTREDEEKTGQFNLGRSLGRLVDTRPDSIFMIKFNYYWNL